MHGGRDLRGHASSGLTTPSGRSADPPRLADVPGARGPDLGVFVQALEEELARRGPGLERAVRQPGGREGSLPAPRPGRGERGPQLPAGRRLRALPRPDRAAGRARLSCAPRRDAHGQDVRNIGAFPGVRAATRYVVAERGCRRGLRLPPPRARDEGAGSPRQGGGRRLRRRPRAVPRRAGTRASPALPLRRLADPRKNVVRLAGASSGSARAR